MNRPARRLRDYEERDRPALADLWVASWRDTGFAVDFEARRPWLLERLEAHHAAGGAVIVGLDARRTARGLRHHRSRERLSRPALRRARAEGVAGSPRRCSTQAKRLSPQAIELDVNEANARARRFYEREGFVFVTRGESVQSGLPTLRLRWTPTG